MIHVYLDDLRPCPRGFVLARSMAECLTLLADCEVHILSLDHDLGWDEPTGYDLVREMVRRGLFAREIFLHTANPIGRMNMFQLLYRYKPKDVQVYNYSISDERLRAIAGTGG